MRKKTKKINNRFHSKSIFVSSIGLLFVIIPFIWKLSQTDLSFNNASAYELNRSASFVNKPTLIYIPKLNTTLDVEGGNVVDDNWEVSDKGVSHYVYSSVPGENGNIVIYGHNKSEIFGNLDKISKGDYINLYTTDRLIHKYVVSSIEEVTPDRVDVIAPTRSEVLTIYTCTGLFDSKRLVVKAKPV